MNLALSGQTQLWVNLRKPIDTDKNKDYISNDVDLGISKSITIDISKDSKITD